MRRLPGRSTFSTFAGFAGGLEGAGFELTVLSVAGVVTGGALVLGRVAFDADDGPPHDRSSAEQAIHREFMRAF